MLRVAGIGAGYFSRFHYDAWSRLEGVELAAVCDRERAKALEVADLHGCAAFDDAAAMLDSIRPDLVDIVTPPATHRELIALAAARGLPMICQKPLAPTLAEARALVETAERAGVLLVAHENFRFQPWYGEVRRLLADGAIGEVHQLSFRLRPGDGQGPRAYLDRQPYFQDMERFLVHETAIHLIDVFRYLAGEPTAVTARLRRLNPAIRGEDAGLFLLEMDTGVQALFDGNRLVDHEAANTRLTMGEMLVEGAGGQIRLDGDGRLHLREKGGRWRPHDYGWHDRGFGGDSVYRLQAHVVAHLTVGAPLVNTGRDYLRNLEIEEAVYRAHAEGRRIELQGG
jgi:D-apiose dehydrogenase